MVAQSNPSGTKRSRFRSSFLRWLIALGGPALATLLTSWASTDRDISIGLFSLAVLTAAVVGGPLMGLVALVVSCVAEVVVVLDQSPDQGDRVLAVGTLALCGLGIIGLTFWLAKARRSTEREAARTRRLHELTTQFSTIDNNNGGLQRVGELTLEVVGAQRAILSVSGLTSGSHVDVGEPDADDAEGRPPDEHRVRELTLPSSTLTEGVSGTLTLTFAERPPASMEFDQFLEAVAAQCAQTVERLELRRAEQRAHADDEFLARATATLSSSLDTEAVVAALRKLTVPSFADRCEVALALGQRDQPPPLPVTGERDWAMNLILRSRNVGWIHLHRANRPFDADDRALAEELALRVGQAVENATLYDEQARASSTLQRSLLPHALLPAPNLHLAARYVPATERHEVGGDFYDAMSGTEGSVVLIIGDVQGKGMEAATLTSVARHTLRTAALDGDGPKAMLLRLNHALLYSQHEVRAADEEADDEGIRFVSAAVVVLVPDDQGFKAITACAGHPSPMHVQPEGTVSPMAASGMVLGVVEDPDIEERTIDLRFADTVVLVTDGVTEQYDGTNFFDESDLRRLVVNRTGPVDADAIAELIEETALLFSRGTPRDDIAVLVACVTGPR